LNEGAHLQQESQGEMLSRKDRLGGKRGGRGKGKDNTPRLKKKKRTQHSSRGRNKQEETGQGSSEGGTRKVHTAS